MMEVRYTESKMSTSSGDGPSLPSGIDFCNLLNITLAVIID